MRSNIFSLSMLNLLRPALVAGVLLVGYIFIAISIFPLVIRFPDLADWINNTLKQNQLFSDLVGTVNDPVGYLNFTGLSLLFPLVLASFAALAGQGSINNSESRAAVELLLARPLLRRRLILEKYASMALVLVLICAALWAVIALRAGPSQMQLDGWQLTQAILGLSLLSLFYASAGLAAGAILRSSARSLAAALAVVAIPFVFYLMQGLPGTAGQLKYFSPFYYAAGTNPLAEGLKVGPVLLLAGLAGACLALAVAAFEQRDL